MAIAHLNPVIDSISGSVGKLVFYERYGKTVMRAYIIPPNPRTAAQQANRSRFRQAMASWRQLPDYEKDSYNRRARKLSMTGHNLYISRYMKGTSVAERVQTGIAPAYRGDNDGGLFPDSYSPSPFRRGGRGVRSATTNPAQSKVSDTLHGLYRSVSSSSSPAYDLFLPRSAAVTHAMPPGSD
ncbi:MAG TPA: hypothetical protein P5295_05685 [Spirochaetota bacterium]|nr:hypothetical protein [Spirochaetota bacterium]